jgi:carbamoyltransferase
MEFEYAPTCRDRLNAIPPGVAKLRVQTIPDAPPDDVRRYRLLHRRFGDATGLPVLINTSFNGFSEPIVCSPRDAIRVFFGTGLDLLVLDRFVLRK